MTLSLIFALEAEGAPWRARHSFQRVIDGGHVVYDAQIGPARVRVAASGVRAPRIHELAAVVFEGHTDAVVAVGLAGGLRPQYVAGDIVAARSTRSGAYGSVISSDDRLVSLASRCGAIVVESLISVDHVIGRAQEKRRLAEYGDVVDMESFRVLTEAARRGISGVAIRVVGDSADEDLPLDFMRTLRADGVPSPARLLAEVVRRPHHLASLVPFGLRQRRALRALAAFLDRFVPELGNSQAAMSHQRRASAGASGHGPNGS